MFRSILPAFLVLPLLAPASPQQTIPQRDPAAVVAVQQAVTALGGFTAAGLILDARVTGTIAPASGSSLPAGSFVWEDAPPEFRYTLQTPTEARVFASGHGQPVFEKNGVVHALFPHMATASLPFHLPAVVLAHQLRNVNCSVKLIGNTTVASNPAIHVRMSVDTDPVSAQVTPEDWYFNSVTGLPLRVEYRLPENRRADDFSVETEEFSNFQAVSGLQIPYLITIYRDEVLQGAATINSVAFNVGLSSSEFDLLPGVQQ